MFSCLFSFILYCVYVCIFCALYSVFSLLFVSNSQVIGCEDPLRNDLYCVGWGLNSTQPTNRLLVLAERIWIS